MQMFEGFSVSFKQQLLFSAINRSRFQLSTQRFCFVVDTPVMTSMPRILLLILIYFEELSTLKQNLTFVPYSCHGLVSGQ